MGSTSLSWNPTQREVLDSLHLLRKLSEERRLAHHSIKGSTVTYHESIWSSLTQLISSEDSQKILNLIARVRGVMDTALKVLQEQLDILSNSQESCGQNEALIRAQMISHYIVQASKGLYTQIETYKGLKGVPRRLGRLLMYTYQQLHQSLAEPEISAAIYRCLTSENPDSIHKAHALTRNFKQVIQHIQDLQESKALITKEVQALKGTEERYRRLWRSLYRLLWRRPLHNEGIPLSLSPELKEGLRGPLLHLTMDTTPVQVLKRFFNRSTMLPSFTVNGSLIELDPEKRPRHYMYFCSLLLVAVNRASILPAMGVEVEEYGKKLADYMLDPSVLEDNEQCNDSLTDLPAPDCMGKLMRLLQPMLFDARVLLGAKLAPLSMAVLPGEEAANEQTWKVKIDIHGPASTVSQARDYFIGDFMGKPLAYITLEHDMWRESGKPWQVIAVRCSYIRFFRGVNEAQKGFVIENLSLSDELKKGLHSAD